MDFALSEKWLGDTGGWAALKQAKALVASGAVLGATFDGKVLKGAVQEGKRRFSSGLLIRGRTDAENLCSCPESRRSGQICGHSLAVGLAFLADAKAPLVSTPLAKSAPPSIRSRFQFRLPVNLAESLARGRVSLAVEESPADAPDPADAPFLAWLLEQKQSAPPRSLSLDAKQAGALFRALRGHPRLSWGDRPLAIADFPLRLPLRLSSMGEQVGLTLAKPSAPFLAAGDATWVFLAEKGVLLECACRELPTPDAEALWRTLTSGQPWTRSWRWFFQWSEALENAFQIDASALPSRPNLREGKPRFRLELEGSLNHLAGRLTCRYDEVTARCGDASPATAGRFPYPSPNSAGEFIARNLAAESAALDSLRRVGFSEPDAQGQMALRGQNAILAFFASHLPRLRREWDVEIGSRFAEVTRGIERVRPVAQSASPALEGGWLDVDIGYATDDGERLPREEIQRLLRVGQSHAKLANGKLVAIDREACEELDEMLRDVNPGQSSGHFRVGEAQMDYLWAALDPERLRAAPLPPFPEKELADLASVYRDYQKHGVRWMLGRHERGLSSILADEMGLGKTAQTLGVLKTLHDRESSLPSLIVAPTSLLENWRQEAARFTPSLKTLVLHGAERKERRRDQADLLITSYALLARDLEEHKAREHLAVVLDEASLIRNPRTQMAQAVCQLRAKTRIALTGTPIENSARDIWSIMRFIAPGYLGSNEDFRQRYELPLSAENPAPEIRRRFRRRLEPFVLRRVKSEVAKELPAKLEQVQACAMSPLQRDLYTEVLRAGREKLLDAEGNAGAAHMTMLTTLLRLRQICCDPRLTGFQDGRERTRAEWSGKLEAVEQWLPSAVDAGHRVLVFSQFVGMLRLLRETLADLKLDCSYLDGSSQDRAAQVARFQRGGAPVFLVSLKAGGYGLNLTAADTVLHFDPWWNPAVEAQATDRAHRIGQTRVVTVHKLVMQGTVEERILRLQRKKRGLIDAALEEESPMMRGLKTEDLVELLEP